MIFFFYHKFIKWSVLLFFRREGSLLSRGAMRGLREGTANSLPSLLVSPAVLLTGDLRSTIIRSTHPQPYDVRVCGKEYRGLPAVLLPGELRKVCDKKRRTLFHHNLTGTSAILPAKLMMDQFYSNRNVWVYATDITRFIWIDLHVLYTVQCCTGIKLQTLEGKTSGVFVMPFVWLCLISVLLHCSSFWSSKLYIPVIFHPCNIGSLVSAGIKCCRNQKFTEHVLNKITAIFSMSDNIRFLAWVTILYS
jgi:hypothetical protein